MNSIKDKFINKKNFSNLVEKTVQDLKISNMEAILHICKENDIEVEDVKKFISEPIRKRIESEAVDLNYLPKQNTLF